ncbi:MFS transporter [Oleomonas cavernae]|uniref:MFS transporter n=1 Tax=Oleomonas cavernae TaxID=2320859 RepID=A0A418WC59_9PROT|nr:MFS transporter [Oleomonas cavernae]RJF87546.1 MFS transporter [Oleomonas cavernae]
MLKTLIAVAALLVGIGCVSAGNAVLATTVGIRLGLDHVPSILVSFVLTGYPLGFLLGCLYARPAIGKVGPVHAFAAFGGLTTVAALGLALVDDPYVWTVLRAASGFCSAGLYTVAESWLNSRATVATRGAVLAAYMITDKLAYSGGQGIVASGDPATPLLFVVSGLILAFCLVPVSLSTAEAPQASGRSRYGFRQLMRVSPLGIAATAGSGLANTAVSLAGPIYAAAIGLDTGQIALFMSMLFLGGLALQWPIGWLSDHFDRRLILLGALVATCLTAVGMAVVGRSAEMLYLMGFLYGGAAFVIYPLAVGHANDMIAPDQVVAVSAGLLMSWAIGSVGGPPIAGLMMGWVGPSGLFIYVAVVTGLLALFTIYRMRVRASVPNELQGKFVPLPTTSVAAPLNPRSERPPSQPADARGNA